MGRTTKLNDQTQTPIVEAIELGMYEKDAAQTAGITEATFHNWQTNGNVSLNYYSGKSFENDLNLRAGRFTVGVQTAVLNPHTGEWLLDKCLTFGSGMRAFQRHCDLKH